MTQAFSYLRYCASQFSAGNYVLNYWGVTLLYVLCCEQKTKQQKKMIYWKGRSRRVFLHKFEIFLWQLNLTLHVFALLINNEILLYWGWLTLCFLEIELTVKEYGGNSSADDEMKKKNSFLRRTLHMWNTRTKSKCLPHCDYNVKSKS